MNPFFKGFSIFWPQNPFFQNLWETSLQIHRIFRPKELSTADFSRNLDNIVLAPEGILKWVKFFAENRLYFVEI